MCARDWGRTVDREDISTFLGGKEEPLGLGCASEVQEYGGHSSSKCPIPAF